MTDDQIMTELTDVFHDLFADSSIVLTPQTTAKDVAGWDSIKHISLIVAVEDRFDIKIKTAEIVGSSRVDLQACKLEYSIVSPK